MPPTGVTAAAEAGWAGGGGDDGDPPALPADIITTPPGAGPALLGDWPAADDCITTVGVDDERIWTAAGLGLITIGVGLGPPVQRHSALCGGYNYDLTTIRRAFDGRSTGYKRSLESSDVTG